MYRQSNRSVIILKLFVFEKKGKCSAAWKSAIKQNHNFTEKPAFSVKSMVLSKKLQNNWFHGKVLNWQRNDVTIALWKLQLWNFTATVNSQIVRQINFTVNWFDEKNCVAVNFPHCCVPQMCKIDKFTLTKFVKSTLGIIASLLSRNFCQKCVRAQWTVHKTSWNLLSHFFWQKFRAINVFW